MADWADKSLTGDLVAARPFNFQYSMILIPRARLRQMDSVGYYQLQDLLKTHSTINMTL
jgi:hypothetical protein